MLQDLRLLSCRHSCVRPALASDSYLSRTNLDASRGTEPMNKPPPRAGALRTTRESRLPSAACMVIVINKSGSAPTVTAQRPIAAVQDPASKQRS